MKIVLDRRSCNCYDQACETHFGWHFLRDEVTPVDCMIELVEDGSRDRVFLIKDKDGTEKELAVNAENWADAYDSWRLALDSQNKTGEG
jgi:hypothetical protein